MEQTGTPDYPLGRINVVENHRVAGPVNNMPIRTLSHASSRHALCSVVCECLLACLALGAVALTGCGTPIEKVPPRPRASSPAAGFELNVPQVMRGTVASETIILGYQPVVVRGYGLVVGLNGTGSRDMPPQVRAFMLQEMARRKVGSETTQWGYIKPEALLDSLDTAVVVVEAVIPPAAVGREVIRNNVRLGAPIEDRGTIIPGTKFDVRVIADPNTGTTSLEGGTLWTCELRPGPLNVGGKQAASIAEAYGPVFVNPYAEPNAVHQDTITRTVGRILGGGEVTRDIPIKLRLARPSHARVATIRDAINARFPEQPGQRGETAHGESDHVIAINVPPSFRNSSEEFVRLLAHTTIRQAGVEIVAMSVRRALEANPEFAEDASWRWQALGVRCLPIIRDLYDSADEAPRLAALRAGAALSDPRVARPLIDMADSASTASRMQAISLLSKMGHDPIVDHSLRRLHNDMDVDVRLAAYEASIQRRDPFIERVAVGNKFILDIIPSDEPMIYTITDIGQPRIAIFQRNLALTRPLTVNAWSNRLLIKDYGDDLVEVYFRQNDNSFPMVATAKPELRDFIVFLGHQPDIQHPQPGLGLSYGETIGAIYQIWRQGYIKADFKTERDRVLAAIRDAEKTETIIDRPEFSDPDFDIIYPDVEPTLPETNPSAASASDLDRVSGFSDLERREFSAPSTSGAGGLR